MEGCPERRIVASATVFELARQFELLAHVDGQAMGAVGN